MTTSEPEIQRPAIPYQSAPAPVPQFSWLVFLCTTGLSACAAVLLLLIVPRFKVVFHDFKLQLPWPTQLLLSVSDFASGWGLLGFLVIPVGLGLLTPRLIRRPPTAVASDRVAALNRVIALLVVVCFALVLTVITAVLVMLPMLSLVEGISGSQHP